MFHRTAILLSFAMMATSLFADDAVAILRPEFEHKTLLLRGFYDGDNLHFDSSGSLKQPAKPASWTTSFLEIQSLAVSDGALEIKALRIAQ
jgi:hypothetical protein